MSDYLFNLSNTRGSGYPVNRVALFVWCFILTFTAIAVLVDETSPT